MNPTNYEHEQLVAALAFLASPPEVKAAAFATLPEVASYRVDDGEAIALRPAEVLLRSCAVVLDRHAWTCAGELNQLVGELYCAIQMALVIGEKVIDYHYSIDKSNFPVSGPFDAVWAIMSRLARHALTLEGARSKMNPQDTRLLMAAGNLRPSQSQ